MQEEKLKTVFSLGGMMAHELRTPLASIKLALQDWRGYFPKIFEGYKIYAQEHHDDTFRKPQLVSMETALDDAERSVENARHIINTILADVRYAMETTTVVRKPINVRQTVEQAVNKFPFQRQQKELVTVKGASDCFALGDVDLVVHVLHNLMKNALHAIEEADKGEIVVTVRPTKKHVEIIFEDTAKGIPKKILPHIFEPFYTTKKETAASIGVGLHFCRLALEKIEGSITCESIESKYTRFIISLISAENS